MISMLIWIAFLRALEQMLRFLQQLEHAVKELEHGCGDTVLGQTCLMSVTLTRAGEFLAHDQRLYAELLSNEAELLESVCFDSTTLINGLLHAHD